MGVARLLPALAAAMAVIAVGSDSAAGGCNPNLPWQDRYPSWAGERIAFQREQAGCTGGTRSDVIGTIPDLSRPRRRLRSSTAYVRHRPPGQPGVVARRRPHRVRLRPGRQLGRVVDQAGRHGHGSLDRRASGRDPSGVVARRCAHRLCPVDRDGLRGGRALAARSQRRRRAKNRS